MNRARALKRLTVGLLLLWTVAVLSGCGGGNPAVEGTVTLDGAPLDDGMISFFAAPNEPDKAHAQIGSGKYSLAAGQGPPPGNYRVEIAWSKKADAKSKKDPDRGGDTIQLKRTGLNAEIKPGANTCNFDIKSAEAVSGRSGAPQQIRRDRN